MKINKLIQKLNTASFTSSEAQNVLDYLLTIKKNDSNYLKYFELTYQLLTFKKQFNNLKLWESGVTFQNTRYFIPPKNRKTYKFSNNKWFYITD